MKRLVAGVVVAGVLTATSNISTSLTHATSSDTSKQASSTRAPSTNDIVQTAKQYLGSPYAYIGNTPAGFSCIGFVNFVFHQNGVYVPFDIPRAWNSAPHVDKSQLLPGDVLFFSNTVFAGLSHVGIYIGNGQMIGADSFAVGVTTDLLSDPYWASHYTGATRPLALVGTSPAPGTVPVPAPAPPPVPLEQAIVANAPAGSWLQPIKDSLNLLSGPGYEYSALTSLGQSSKLYVVQSQGGWYNVRTPSNVYGWVTAGGVRQINATQVKTQNTSITTPGLSKASAISSSKPSSVMFVAVGPLLVRSGPSKSFGSIGFVQIGAQLAVYQTKPHWVRVGTPSGQVGWVAMQYLSTTKVVKASSDTVQTSTSGNNAATGAFARVTTPALNVRAMPDSEARVVSVLFSGETVQVIARRSGWNEVKLRSGATGWASARYLSTD
ncbi:MAG: hypothetical protein JWO42_657 [Chloroflexi bacterium]|nr:hypothetical protein [Chloroflexota bacterium]